MQNLNIEYKLLTWIQTATTKKSIQKKTNVKVLQN